MKKLLLTSAFTLMSAFAFQCLAWTGKNWMSEIPNDTYVSELSIPGAHDAATGYGTNSDTFSQTQEKDIAEQLQLGVRAFDFRPKVNGNTINAQHGIVNCKITFDDAMKNVIGKFLDENPSEFVVLHLLYAVDTAFDSDKTKYAQLLKALFESDELKGKAVAFHRGLTVGEMRGKILVLSREKYDEEPYFGGFFEYWSEEYNNITNRSRIIGASGDFMNNAKLFVQDRAETQDNKDEKAGFMTNLLNFTTRYSTNGDPANCVWAINFLSSYSYVSTEYSYKTNATYFNKLFVDYINSADYIPGPTGIVMMDYVGESDTYGDQALNGVINNNFKYIGAENTPATGSNPQFRLERAWLYGEGTYYSCGGDKAVPIIADFDSDGRMDYYCSGQSYEWYDDKWNWNDASYMAFNYGFGHPYGFEAYDNSGVKRGEARVADNNEDYLPIVYGAQVRALTDLNQDGAVDFLVWDCEGHGWGNYKKYTPWNDTNNQVLINNGDGTQFSQITGYPNNLANNKHGDWGCSLPGKYHRLSIGDVNCDGYPDILMVLEKSVANYDWYKNDDVNYDGANLYINNGDNTFTHKFIASIRNYYSTALFGDFNCDGYPDILLNGWHDAITGADGKSIDGDWELVIMTNDGKGNFSVAYHSEDYGKDDDNGTETAIHVLDYDQDGKMDILLSGTTNKNSFDNTNGRDGKVAFILRNESDGTNVAFSEVLTDLHPSSVAMQRTSILADFNGDGFIDYLANGWGPNSDWSTGTYLSYSQGKYNSNYALNNGVIHYMEYNGNWEWEEENWITFGDMDGDGMLDLVSPAGDGAPRVYLNRTLEGKNQYAQVPDAPTSTKATYDKDRKRVTFTWNKMYTKSGSKAIYNTYLRRVDGLERAVSGTIMRVPADITTGKLKAYTEWSTFLPGETCFFENLEDGTYEFGVQSVAYNYGSSEFTTHLFKIENDIVTGVDEIVEEEEMNTLVNVYNMQGMLLKQGVDRENALDNLPAGLYIVGDKKILKQ